MGQDEMVRTAPVTRGSFARAKQALDAVRFGDACRRVIIHWLSKWDDDLLPHLADFRDDLPRGLEHSLILLEVWPHRAITIRCAGALVQNAFGMDLTNCDLIALTAEEDRAKRLAGISEIALGCAARGIRVVEPKFGAPMLVEDVMLPFRDCTPQGSRFAVTYLDSGAFTISRPEEGLVVDAPRLAATVTMIPLC